MPKRALSKSPDHGQDGPKGEGVKEPGANDVISGRGDTINRHPGNVKFRSLVDKQRRVYLTSNFKREKRMIAQTIVDTIQSLDPPGRFLSKDPKSGLWFVVSNDRAREKTAQALRENSKKLRAEIETDNQKTRNARSEKQTGQRTTQSGHVSGENHDILPYPYMYPQSGPAVWGYSAYYGGYGPPVNQPALPHPAYHMHGSPHPGHVVYPYPSPHRGYDLSGNEKNKSLQRNNNYPDSPKAVSQSGSSHSSPTLLKSCLKSKSPRFQVVDMSKASPRPVSSSPSPEGGRADTTAYRASIEGAEQEFVRKLHGSSSTPPPRTYLKPRNSHESKNESIRERCSILSTPAGGNPQLVQSHLSMEESCIYDSSTDVNRSPPGHSKYQSAMSEQVESPANSEYAKLEHRFASVTRHESPWRRKVDASPSSQCHSPRFYPASPRFAARAAPPSTGGRSSNSASTQAILESLTPTGASCFSALYEMFGSSSGFFHQSFSPSRQMKQATSTSVSEGGDKVLDTGKQGTILPVSAVVETEQKVVPFSPIRANSKVNGDNSCERERLRLTSSLNSVAICPEEKQFWYGDEDHR